MVDFREDFDSNTLSDITDEAITQKLMQIQDQMDKRDKMMGDLPEFVFVERESL